MKVNLCKKCRNPKIMYFREYCPRCEKPKPRTQYNLIECLHYIEATGHPGFKDEFWEMLIDMEDIINDTAIQLWNDPEGNNPLLKELFYKMHLNEPSMFFEVSW